MQFSFTDICKLPHSMTKCKMSLTLILLTWRIWWAPNNASKWQMGFNSAFKGLRVETNVISNCGTERSEDKNEEEHNECFFWQCQHLLRLYLASVVDEWISRQHWWEDIREIWNTWREKNCSGATLVTINPTWLVLRLNPGIHNERSVTNNPSHSTVSNGINVWTNCPTHSTASNGTSIWTNYPNHGTAPNGTSPYMD